MDGEENPPKRVVESRQDNAVVAGHEEVESRSPTCAAANRSQSIPDFGIFKCKDKRFLTCPTYISLNINLSLT